MATKDTPQDWNTRIEKGYDYRKKYGYSDSWDHYRGYYRGEFEGYHGALDSSDAILPFNITYMMKNTIVPNVYFRNPYVSVTPRFGKTNFEMNAKIVEATANWLISEMGFKQEARHAVGTCFFTNRGIFKIGYDSYYGFSSSKMGESGDATATDMDKTGKYRLEYNSNVRPGMPWVTSCDSESIIVPFGTRTLTTSPWIDHIVLRRLEDVKADQKYDKTVTREMSGSHIEWLSKDNPLGTFYDDLTQADDWVELHEIRDARDGRIKVMATGSNDKWLRHEPDVLQVDGLPFADFTFNDDTQLFWGAPDARIIEPQQFEMNETRTQQMFHRRIALLKFLFEQDGIEDTEIEKFLGGAVGIGVKCKGKPKDIVTTVQPHVPQDMMLWAETIRSDARELLGVGRPQSGVGEKSSRRTAREIDFVQSGFDTRIDERRDRIADALQSTLRKVLQLVFKFWKTNRVVQVVGYDGATYWVEFNGAAIRGEFNLQVDVESMAPQTKGLRRKELLMLVQSLAKYPGANLDYLIKNLLREYPYIDAMKVLPQAPETAPGKNPMSADDFTKHQGRLLTDSKFRENRVSENAGRLDFGGQS